MDKKQNNRKKQPRSISFLGCFSMLLGNPELNIRREIAFIVKITGETIALLVEMNRRTFFVNKAQLAILTLRIDKDMLNIQ